MIKEKLPEASEKAFLQLENRLDDLIHTCERLKTDNTSLKKENDTLHSERGQLMANRDKVRTQVEAMITRLKTLESG